MVKTGKRFKILLEPDQDHRLDHMLKNFLIKFKSQLNNLKVIKTNDKNKAVRNITNKIFLLLKTTI
jgi:hypothetical protein